ncbi:MULTISPECIES: bifunctional nuclease family protein [unclassified Corynebacterium]|uniref:bifunctional nuclease family protein n=1 Tax=unclassified Corynebacterium TaxID=2624378 RepID=UPI0029CA4D2B|nr:MULTISPECIES: bifunctional nuclease family protein [unclassified Corynebacterium]WPF67147.1 bifunctional nuclease family protein [Corynebacterium sp. 22KM0430]WPF69636.1 bifunctional nuclease family protein [Corynebacterium sp. 21KM1197]
MIPIEFHGVHSTGPENFFCVVLRWAQRNRVLPLWVSSLAAAEIEARAAGYEPRRPGTVDLLAETLQATGVAEIGITSAFEGVFVATITLNDGTELDARPSDALMVAQALELPFGVAEEVLTQFSFFAADDALSEYLHVTFGEAEEPVSASGDAQADADFERMMRELGVSEEDLSGDTDVTRDDNDGT